MTRQKREIEKRIDEIQRFIDIDQELGCGFAPAGAYEVEEREIYRLYEQLAHLRHYQSVEAMMYDCRGVCAIC